MVADGRWTGLSPVLYRGKGIMREIVEELEELVLAMLGREGWNKRDLGLTLLCIT